MEYRLRPLLVSLNINQIAVDTSGATETVFIVESGRLFLVEKEESSVLLLFPSLTFIVINDCHH